MGQSSVIERYESKVDRSDSNGCHPWTAYCEEKAGYGIFWFNGRMRPAHRVGWELRFGPIPDGMYLCHRCDNPPCQNPDHWFLGTPTDNAQDRVRKGRSAHGARAGRARLTDDDVREIRRMHAAGSTNKSIADQFGLDAGYTSRLVRRLNWKHID